MQRVAIDSATSILKNLPIEDGIVTRKDREISNGDTQRVWAVELPHQTILLEFVFDMDEEMEEAYTRFLAFAPSLLKSIVQNYLVVSDDLDNLLTAFQVTFNALQREKTEAIQELENMLLLNGNNENPIPTVGEK